MMEISILFRVLAFFIILDGTKGFYLPGAAPVTYCMDADPSGCKTEVQVYVNRLNSLNTALPYEYDRFDLCKNEEEKENRPTLNIGQVVFGERISLSPYKLKFLKEVYCEKLCERTYSPNNSESLQKLDFMRKGIELNYQLHWIIDNMPVTWCYLVEDGNQYCSRSFPLGCFVTENSHKKDACVMSVKFSEANTHYFFNHIDLTITYHSGRSEDWGQTNTLAGRIISAKVDPRSVAYVAEEAYMCRHDNPMGIKGGKLEKETTVRYTYSVTWQEDRNTRWSSRWDYILDSMPHSNIMVFSMVNSLVVLFFLTAIMVRIATRTLSKSQSESTKRTSCCKKTDNQFNWKLIYGDIFRPPCSGMLFAILNGSGVQVFFTALITLVFATIGFLSPAKRGALETCILISFVCLGFPAGYVSARLYKAFGGEKKMLNALLTATTCPGFVFVLAMILNLVFWIEGSSAALPYTTVFALLGMWFGISLPLTFLGAFFGFRKKTIKQPVKTEPVPRPVPKLKFYLKPFTGMLVGGILPFGCIFIQIFFVLNSMWSAQVYYSYGFLLLTFLLLVFNCSLVTITMCYFHLCAEDYRWWWRSFLNSSFTSIYFFVYCIHYYVSKLSLQGGVSALLYFGYMIIATFLVFLLTGTIGFFSCFWFVRKIYSNVKGYEMWSTKG